MESLQDASKSETLKARGTAALLEVRGEYQEGRNKTPLLNSWTHMASFTA